jgi:hypothetical protein
VVSEQTRFDETYSPNTNQSIASKQTKIDAIDCLIVPPAGAGSVAGAKSIVLGCQPNGYFR